ncbi:MAG: hypothetical protein BMS9Abin05_0615 [Rhodothermia bacterium]|nr:MAG: hypothetical protein BMS9Abin05_0615 [Rhodothermia bacterium]
MTKRTFFLIAFLFALPLVSRAGVHVTLRYPRGGETFTSGTTVTIEWQLDILHDSQNWDLYFSPNGGVTWQQIRINIPLSQLTYFWVVPNIITTEGRVKVVQDNTGGNYEASSFDFSIIAVATNLDGQHELPSSPALLSSFPNPFSSETVFEFALESAEYVRLEVFDVLGRSVAVLIDRKLARGVHRIKWNGAGRADGVYFSRIIAGSVLESNILLLVR